MSEDRITITAEAVMTARVRWTYRFTLDLDRGEFDHDGGFEAAEQYARLSSPDHLFHEQDATEPLVDVVCDLVCGDGWVCETDSTTGYPDLRILTAKYPDGVPALRCDNCDVGCDHDRPASK